MFLLFILGGSGLCLADDKAQAADWYSPDWGYRKAITVDNTSGGALTNYQVLITLSTANGFDYAKANTDGSDLRFTGSDELTEISYWIEDWNTSGDSRIWIKVPSIPAESTDTVYLYYGNSIATTSLSSFDNTMQKLEADEDTVGLWHFDDGAGTTLEDSSSNTNNGRMDSFAVDDSDWVADATSEHGGSGSALNFDGIDDYIEVLNHPSLNLGSNNFTIEGWVKTVDGTPVGSCAVSKYFVSAEAEAGFFLGINKLHLYYNLQDFTGGDETILGNILIDDGNWHYIAALREGTTIRSYIDGELEQEVTDISIGNIDNSAPLLFSQENGENFLRGQLDEFRISTRALSAGEIKADYERRQYAPTEPTSALEIEETNPYNASQTVIATDGGTITNTADTVSVEIPVGALTSDTEITIETSEAIGDFQVQDTILIDYVYTFGPSGTTFDPSATIVLDYDDAGMTLMEEEGLDIYLYNETLETWEAQGAVIDTTLNTLTLSITHFSKYAIGGNVVILKEIDELLLLIDNYYEEGKIEKSAYSLSVHLKRVQRLLKEGDDEKATTVLSKFIEKVERFTPSKINPDASTVIIDEINEIISLL